MTRRTSFLAFTIILAFLAMAPTAYAAKINDEGAQHLKKIFDDIISYQEGVSALKKQGHITYQGDVIVEPAKQYYAVTLPHISIIYPDGARLELGIISVNAVPDDQEGRWKMTTALPTPIVLFNKAGAAEMKIDIGAQLSVGIWDERLSYFTKLDARYQGIKVERMDGKVNATIPEIEIIYDLTEDAERRWSGPIQGTIRGVAMNFPETGGAITLREARLAIKMFSYIPQAVKDYKEKLMAMAEAGKDSSVSTQHVAGLYNMIVELLGNAGDGFTTQYEVTGLDITRPVKEKGSTKAGTGLENLYFEKLNIGFDLTGFLQNQIKMAVRFGFDGYKPPPYASESTGRIMPTSARLDIQFNNIPFQKIADLGRNTITGQAGIASMPGFALKLPAILSEAGTTIDFSDNHFGNNIYHITADGKIRADITALNSATADIRLRAKGLDQLKADLAVEGDDPLNENAADFQRIAAQIQILEVLAEKKNDDSGNLIHLLNFEMNPQGEMLINGQDIRLLFDGRAAERQKPAENATPKPQQDNPDSAPNVPAEGTAP